MSSAASHFLRRHRFPSAGSGHPGALEAQGLSSPVPRWPQFDCQVRASPARPAGGICRAAQAVSQAQQFSLATGTGGKLCVGLRKSFGLRKKEGVIKECIAGEDFSIAPVDCGGAIPRAAVKTRRVRAPPRHKPPARPKTFPRLMLLP